MNQSISFHSKTRTPASRSNRYIVREVGNPLDVASMDYQQTDVHATQGRCPEGLYIRARGNEVGIGQPQRLPHASRQHQIQTVDSIISGEAGTMRKDTDPAFDESSLRGNSSEGIIPPASFHAAAKAASTSAIAGPQISTPVSRQGGIFLLSDSHPGISDTKAGYKGLGMIYGNQFPMIPAEPPQKSCSFLADWQPGTPLRLPKGLPHPPSPTG